MAEPRLERPCRVCGLRTREQNTATPMCRSCKRGDPVDHGNLNTYRRGCNCDACLEASRETQRDRRATGKWVENRSRVTKQCLRCGADFTTRRHVAAATLCRSCRPRTTAQVRRDRCTAKQRTAAAGTTGMQRPYIAGYCVICHTPYCQRATGHDSRTTYRRWCTEKCRHTHLRNEARRQHQIAKARRRLSERAAFVQHVDRERVFAADGWRCHICNRKCRRNAPNGHPLEPTIDHIEPVSLGGRHEPENLRTAHRACNSKRGNRGNPGGGEQWALFV